MNVFYCLSVIAYPGTIIIFPFLLVYLFINNRTYGMYFFIACFILFILYLLVFIFMKNVSSYREFIYLVKTIISSDQKHTFNIKLGILFYDIFRLLLFLLVLFPIPFMYLKYKKILSLENLFLSMMIELFILLPIALLILNRGSIQSGTSIVVLFLVFMMIKYKKSNDIYIVIFCI